MITTSHKSKEPPSTAAIFYNSDIFLLVVFFLFPIRVYFLFYHFLPLFLYILCYCPESIILHKTLCAAHTRSQTYIERDRWISTNFFLIFFRQSFLFLARSLYKQVYISAHMTTTTTELRWI
jgi:hypothetical protein